MSINSFGTKPWDEPKSLHEMLTDKDARALAYVADYKLNLLEPAAMKDEDIAGLQSDLKDVFYFIKYSTDKKKLQEPVENNEDFRRMRKSTAEMIKTATNTNMEFPQGEEQVNMCLAIQLMQEESEARGLNRGRLEGKLEGQIRRREEEEIGDLI